MENVQLSENEPLYSKYNVIKWKEDQNRQLKIEHLIFEAKRITEAREAKEQIRLKRIENLKIKQSKKAKKWNK